MPRRPSPFIILAAVAAFVITPVWSALAQGRIELVLNYVEGSPIPEEIAYRVSAYLSVVDADGNPIQGLGTSNFEVVEDASKVALEGVLPVGDAPIAVILVIDTSGSMIASEAGVSKIAAVREAAAEFVSQLGGQDQAAVLSFNTTVSRDIELTDDRGAVDRAIGDLQAIPDAGTCLYDAVYDAGVLAATLPHGRRAIVLLTDGVDEISGRVCSTHTLDDVIGFASAGATRVPIYTLGIGTRTDPQALRRLAELTGGRYLPVPSANDIRGVFQRVSDQIKSQYVVTYRSQSGPGAHTLIVSVNHAGERDEDSRSFLLPNLPPHVTIVRPTDGETVTEAISILASMAGVGEVAEVTFESNGIPIGRDDTAPYEIEWDPVGAPADSATLAAIAKAADGTVLSRDEVTVLIALPSSAAAAPTLAPPPVPTSDSASEMSGEGEEDSSFGSSLFTFVLLGFGLGVLTFVLLRARRRRHPAVQDSPTTPELPIRTAGVLATLRLLQSDNYAMVGKRWDILSLPKTIGRGADNDIVVPDTPVSRHHVILEANGDSITLREVESRGGDGQMKRPTFGTFVDDEAVGPDPVALRNGDRIRLGKRTVLQFERAEAPPSQDEGETRDLSGDSTRDLERRGQGHDERQRRSTEPTPAASDRTIQMDAAGDGESSDRTIQMDELPDADASYRTKEIRRE